MTAPVYKTTACYEREIAELKERIRWRDVEIDNLREQLANKDVHWLTNLSPEVFDAGERILRAQESEYFDYGQEPGWYRELIKSIVLAVIISASRLDGDEAIADCKRERAMNEIDEIVVEWLRVFDPADSHEGAARTRAMAICKRAAEIIERQRERLAKYENNPGWGGADHGLSETGP